MKLVPHHTLRPATLLLLTLFSFVLAACGGTPAVQTTAVLTPTGVVTPDAPPTVSARSTTETAVESTPHAEVPTAVPVVTATVANERNEKVLVLGDTQPPDTLYGLESNSLATANVLRVIGGQSIGAACYTSLGYEYQPVCFPDFPTFENGGAITRTVPIDAAAISVDNPIIINNSVVTNTTSLAEDVPSSLAQMVITWKLRQDLKWEDGTPVTAKDFILGFKLAKNLATKTSTRYLAERTVGYEAPDDFTLVGTFAPGYTEATYFLNFFPPFPDHVLGNVDPATIGTSDYANKPLSWGPYKIDEYVPNESLRLSANPYYYRAKEGLPKVGTIVFKFIAAQDQLLAQLETGDIDYAGTIGLTLSQSETLDRLVNAGKIKAQYVPGTVWEHLDFGITRGDGLPSFFEDVRVRQAMAYGINRQQIIDSVLLGKTVTMNSFLPNDHSFFPPNGQGLETYPYNPDRAKQLLMEVGYSAGADGILQKDGKPFNVTLYTTEGNATRKATAEIIHQNLKDIGITLELQFVPGPGKLFKIGADGILRSRNYDIGLYAWTAGPDPSTNLYVCDQIPSAATNYGGSNYPGYCNPEYDRVALPAQQETDPTKRAPLVTSAQQIFNRDLPALPLYQRVKIAAHGANVSGPKIDATQPYDFYNIDEWDRTRE